jgi:hypothetical protein
MSQELVAATNRGESRVRLIGVFIWLKILA